MMQAATDDLTARAPIGILARSSQAKPPEPTAIMREDGFRSEVLLRASVDGKGTPEQVRFHLPYGMLAVAPYAQVVRCLELVEYSCTNVPDVTVHLRFDHPSLQTMYSLAIDEGKRAISYALPDSPHRGALSKPVPLMKLDPTRSITQAKAAEHVRLGRYRNAQAILDELLGDDDADDDSKELILDATSPRHNPLLMKIRERREKQPGAFATVGEVRAACKQIEAQQIGPLRNSHIYPHELSGTAWLRQIPGRENITRTVEARLVFHVQLAVFTFAPAAV